SAHSRIRGRSYGRLVCSVSGGGESCHMRIGTVDPSRVDSIFCRAKQLGNARLARSNRLRRRSPFYLHNETKVRCHHDGSDSSMGERDFYTLLEGILRTCESSPE